MQRFLCVGMMLAIVGAIGCGGEPSVQTGKVAEPNKLALEDWANALKSLAADKKSPPAKLAELEPIEPMSPVGGPAIRNGEIVYFWGADLSGGAKIIAHEKSTPTSGGWVLLQDGTVKKMTADEFKSASKVPAKK